MIPEGSRTYALAVGTLASAFVLALLGKLSGDFSAVASICMAAYAGKSAYTIGNGGAPPTPPPMPSGMMP